ncbi:unnamed protein product [Caenorhabditis bovis]|uniref:DIRP domain-containing protein n=1 Tax=Caenorhabditis bovis TaxID=2654633 RepID=A0A8S1EZ82_9PELO|nr:unnamed protein product [Caenorhabditis bovis]
MSPTSRSPRKRLLENGVKSEKSMSPYRLRETSKLPSRYRDDENFEVTTPKSKKTPKKSPHKRSVGKESPPHENEDQSTSSSGSERLHHEEKRSVARRALHVSPKKEAMPYLVPSQNIIVGEEEEVGLEKNVGGDITLKLAPQTSEWMDMQSFYGLFSTDTERDAIIDKFSRYKTEHSLGEIMRINLKKMHNMLRYRKTRQWIHCEFFYSGVDEQIFLGENEFVNILKDMFPNLKTYLLNKTEWRTIRRLMGKPRRCSDTFFEEERQYLEMKRSRIRSVYAGTYLNDPTIDLKDLPSKLPRPLIVGNRVYARVRNPRDGIYIGTIDALLPKGYRVVFDNRDVPPTIIPDHEVMLDGEPELWSIAYFIEQANSKLPNGVRPFEMVGNFPLKFLVILMKLTKLVELKKNLVKQLSDLNTDAEVGNLHTSKYPQAFKEKYAQVIIDLEHINQHIDTNLQGIQEHSTYYMASNELLNVGPEAVRRMCLQHAGRFVEHCNQGLNVENGRALTLIQSLTAVLLQVRQMGNSKISALDLQALSESMSSIRNQISPRNAAYFQDYVEVHMKQFHAIMIEDGAIRSEVLRR